MKEIINSICPGIKYLKWGTCFELGLRGSRFFLMEVI